MRSSRAVLLMCAIAASSAAGQRTPPVRVGITAGLNLATLSNGDGYDSRRPGLVAGGMLVHPLGPDWSVQPELLYSMKGARADFEGFSGALKLAYLELPLLLRFDVPATGGVRPFIVAGPSVALKLSCSVEVKGGGIKLSESCEDQSSDGVVNADVRRFDVGANIGGGLAFRAGRRTMSLGVRYQAGLRSLSPDSDVKNRVLSFIGSVEWPHRR